MTATDPTDHQAGYLDGQLLIAMPTMGDPRFAKSVVYLCAHSADGAVGLVVNKSIDSLTFAELLDQLDIEHGAKHGAGTGTGTDADDDPAPAGAPPSVQFGGPVETQRGFVLHSAEFVDDGTLVVDDKIALTATIDILREIARGTGPRQTLLALGYTGWGPGQLEAEIQDNAWLSAPADADIVFSGALDTKWERALATLGIEQSMLSGTAGRA